MCGGIVCTNLTWLQVSNKTKKNYIYSLRSTISVLLEFIFFLQNKCLSRFPILPPFLNKYRFTILHGIKKEERDGDCTGNEEWRRRDRERVAKTTLILEQIWMLKRHLFRNRGSTTHLYLSPPPPLLASYALSVSLCFFNSRAQHLKRHLFWDGGSNIVWL